MFANLFHNLYTVCWLLGVIVWIITAFGVYRDLAKSNNKEGNIISLLLPMTLLFEKSSYLTTAAREKLNKRMLLFILIVILGIASFAISEHFGYSYYAKNYV